MLDILSPIELIESIDQLIESLMQYEECYECIDTSTRLREEIIDALDIDLYEST